MSVFKKLQEARIELQNMKLEKTGWNAFAKYAYFELGDFLPATQTIFLAKGLCGVVSFTAELASLRIVDTEDGSETTITSPMANADMKGLLEIQKLGAVETYQRRYLWVDAMEIVEHDAVDAVASDESKAASKPQSKTKPIPAPLLDDSDMDDVILAMRECGDVEALKAVFGPAYKKANTAQQATLKSVYDKTKAELTERAA